MKKILFVLMIIFVFTLNAHAQQSVCVVKNGNGATVTITVVEASDDGNVSLSVSSDCIYPVNVNYTLSYVTKGKRIIGGEITKHKKTSQPFNVLAKPNMTNSETVKVGDISIRRDEEYKGMEVTSVNISGARCE